MVIIIAKSYLIVVVAVIMIAVVLIVGIATPAIHAKKTGKIIK